MHFRLVPKSTTLDDFEGPLHTLFQNMSFGAHRENLSEARPILSATKMLPNDSRDSGNIKFMVIFTGVPWRNDSGVIQNIDFQGFRTLRLRRLRK